MSDLTEKEEKIIRFLVPKRTHCEGYDKGDEYDCDNGLIICIILGIAEYNLEDEIMTFIEENPDADIQDVVDLVIELSPPLVIVDDEDL